ncbi:MAG: hypothetical protein IPH10_00795 [bacterium]|nr:hypothetical protein [bacterium]
MKKWLPQIGLYLGTFIVLNVVMFFVLKMTQPKSAVLEHLAGADSLAVHADSLHADSLQADMHAESDSTHAGSETALFDSVAAPEDSSLAEIAEGGHSDSAATQHNAIEDAALTAEVISDDAANDTEAIEGDAESSASVNASPVVADAPQSTAEISKLAKMLEGMKPTEAAVIVESLPTETIVQLVMRMKSRSGAKMMASLPVPVAASVASRMAEISGVRNPS